MSIFPFIIPVMALSIPIIAMINRKESPIGQAIARRISRKHGDGTHVTTDSIDTEQLKRRVAQLEDKVQTLEIELAFTNSLLEAPKEQRTGT